MRTSSLKMTTLAASFALIGHFASETALPTHALAADMLEDYGNTEEYTEVEFGTGWYLRGDLGGGISDISLEASFVSGDVELDSPITLGVAAGRNFAEGVRMEGALNFYEIPISVHRH